MELFRLNDDPAEYPIDTIVKKGIRKIYYVTRIRNAWHSTRVHNYFPGCMHTTFESAKKYAEDARKCGSSFHIEEIPALVIEGRYLCIIVTQINCKDILQYYWPNKKICNNPIFLISPGTRFDKTISSLSHNSIYWEKSPPPNDSVIILTGTCKLSKFEYYNEKKPRSFWSKSIGANNYLQWDESNIGAKNNSLKKIFNGQRKINSIPIIH